MDRYVHKMQNVYTFSTENSTILKLLFYFYFFHAAFVMLDFTLLILIRRISKANNTQYILCVCPLQFCCY